MKTIILILLFFVTLSVSAQRPLVYNNITKEGEVYPMGKNTYARVTISIAMNLKPYFKNKDLQLNPVKTDTLGNEIYYQLDLNAQQFSSLWVNVNGFSPLFLPLENLRPNQWIRYNVYDPDSTIVDCFHQLDREAMKLFQAANYEDAKGKYEELSKTCSDLKDEEKVYVDTKIKMIDTLSMWRNMANEYFTDTNYAKAMEYYGKIYAQNPADEQSHGRIFESQQKLSESCELDFTKAEDYFNDKDYVNATIWYEKVRSQSCFNSTEAEKRLLTIKNIQENKKQCATVLTYEFAKDAPIGFSIGTYKDHKVSGYFTLRFNPDVFEAIRTSTDSTKRPELNISAGWTIPIVKPVWIFFGPGYTGVGKFVTNNNTDNNASTNNLTFKINSAISPEIGLLGKIVLGKVGIALRYTFQYRFALEKDEQDYIGRIRNVFGIGICF